jgi:hypothetical protein
MKDIIILLVSATLLIYNTYVILNYPTPREAGIIRTAIVMSIQLLSFTSIVYLFKQII